MNFYRHHIGDFDRATRHLSRIERSVYRDLLEVYYDTEQRLVLDLPALCRKIIARTNEEIVAVEQTLNEFFTKTPTGWYHPRCEDELEAYRNFTSQKSVAGKASAARRSLKHQQALNAMPAYVEQALHGIPTDVEQTLNGMLTAAEQTLDSTPTNQEPKSNNQEPEGKAKLPQAAPAAPKYSPKAELMGCGVSAQTASDWLAVREAKKAASTKTAIDGVLREISKAGMAAEAGLRLCCERGWVGFKAEWVQPQQTRASSAASQLGKAGQVTAANARTWLEEHDASN